MVNCRGNCAGTRVFAPRSVCRLIIFFLKVNIFVSPQQRINSHNTQAAKAIVSSVLMNVAIVGINQVYDKKLDRVRSSTLVTRLAGLVILEAKARYKVFASFQLINTNARRPIPPFPIRSTSRIFRWRVVPSARIRRFLSSRSVQLVVLYWVSDSSPNAQTKRATNGKAC